MSALPTEGEIFDGKYCIGRVLGVGGMAAVLAAKHLGFDQTVALKVLLPECCDDPAVVERFVQEGRTAIKIRSEHVVRMLDVGVFAGRAYLVMEYLAGSDLEALIRQGGPLPAATAVDLLLQACEAIGEAHALGIIHRDLKPANLFLTHLVDGSASVKVLDFGISKMPRGVSGISGGSYPTLPSTVMGSPQYMSPEQMASSASADQRSDIWSLGAILYELVTGHVAFDGMTTAEVCAHVLVGAPTPISQLQEDVPPAVALVIARCLEKNPSRRYANVSELASALAPSGTAGARASAASIARVFEGGLEVQAPPPVAAATSAATMKPTAAEILAGASPRRRRGAGYLVGSLLALTAAAGVAVVDHTSGTPRLRWPVTLATAPSPLAPVAPALGAVGPAVSAPVLVPVEPAVPAPHASSSPLPVPSVHHRDHPHRAAPSAGRPIGALPVDAGTVDVGPYDAP